MIVRQPQQKPPVRFAELHVLRWLLFILKRRGRAHRRGNLAERRAKVRITRRVVHHPGVRRGPHNARFAAPNLMLQVDGNHGAGKTDMRRPILTHLAQHQRRTQRRRPGDGGVERAVTLHLAIPVVVQPLRHAHLHQQGVVQRNSPKGNVGPVHHRRALQALPVLYSIPRHLHPGPPASRIFLPSPGDLPPNQHL
jgi:hypothetical protein